MLQLTLTDFEQQFGSATERRLELYQIFQEWLAAAKSTTMLRQVWVFGNFATRKPGPGDLDIIALFSADFDVDAVSAPLRHWFDHELCRDLHEMDLFLMKETTPPDVRTMILETFGKSRDGQESIVEVLL